MFSRYDFFFEIYTETSHEVESKAIETIRTSAW